MLAVCKSGNSGGLWNFNREFSGEVRVITEEKKKRNGSGVYPKK